MLHDKYIPRFFFFSNELVHAKGMVSTQSKQRIDWTIFTFIKLFFIFFLVKHIFSLTLLKSKKGNRAEVCALVIRFSYIFSYAGICLYLYTDFVTSISLLAILILRSIKFQIFYSFKESCYLALLPVYVRQPISCDSQHLKELNFMLEYRFLHKYRTLLSPVGNYFHPFMLNSPLSLVAVIKCCFLKHIKDRVKFLDAN